MANYHKSDASFPTNVGLWPDENGYVEISADYLNEDGDLHIAPIPNTVICIVDGDMHPIFRLHGSRQTQLKTQTGVPKIRFIFGVEDRHPAAYKFGRLLLAAELKPADSIDTLPVLEIAGVPKATTIIGFDRELIVKFDEYKELGK